MKQVVRKVVITMILFIISFPSFAKTEMLRHIEALSRDHYYLHIEGQHSAYTKKDIVGGEHSNNYHILGFQGDSFVIVIESSDDSLGFQIEGDGFQHVATSKGDVVLVEAETSWVSIEVYAHPETAEYKLRVINTTQPLDGL